MPSAWEVRDFSRGPVEVEYPEPSLSDGEVRVRIAAAGVCGSDRHIATGGDPRTPLPIIPGHEGVGRVAEIAGEKIDLVGRRLRQGDLITWDRGVTCGKCFFCAGAGQPYLCTERRVYGINVSSADPPHFRGTFAEEIVLFRDTSVYVLPSGEDPAEYVSASCSGATAAHSVEEAGVAEGDFVVVIGPGPLGLWTAALSRESDARAVMMTGTRDSRLELARSFGVDVVANVRETSPESRRQTVLDATGGRGADRVIDTSGRPETLTEGLSMLRKGGTYANSGVAVPVDRVPLDIYGVNLRNISLKGVWVSGTAHFYRAVRLVEEHRYPFERMVTHRLPLASMPQALNMDRTTGVMKAVLVP
ncbi:MAG: zinc-binding dehydrogenase [Planctomycetes bacterium]|nr:zinc-binding dehydrogenase [Planctomycetota bacterium]